MQKHLSAFLTQTSEHTHPKEKIYVQALSVYKNPKKDYNILISFLLCMPLMSPQIVAHYGKNLVEYSI